MPGPTLYNGSIDMQGNQIHRLVIQSVVAFPGTPFAGQIVYRSDLGRYHVYNGTAWRDMTQQLLELTGVTGASIRLSEQVLNSGQNANAEIKVKRFDVGEVLEEAFLRWDETLKQWRQGYGANVYNVPRTVKHTQAVASALWTIVHNLGTKDVIAQVYDAVDDQVIADINTPDVNTVTVTFGSPQTGRVVILG